MSKRTRLLIALATAAVALTTCVAVAWAYEGDVYFVGDGACAENVGAGSDQIDGGWSYDHYIETWSVIAQCNAILTNGAHLRVYGNKTDGTWPCGMTDYDDVLATCTAPYPYVRAHCVNLSTSSSRWMNCYKTRTYP